MSPIKTPSGDCSVRIEWTEPALDDLEDIRDYIAQDSSQNAAAFIQRLFDADNEGTQWHTGMSLSQRPQKNTESLTIVH